METELDHTKKLALAIKERIETASTEERYTILDNLYKKWIIQPNHQNNMFDYLRLALHNFGIDDIDNLEIGAFERIKKVMIFQLNYLHLHFMKEDVEDDDERAEFEGKFAKILRALLDADNAIQFSLFLKSSMTLEEIGKDNKLTKQDLFRFQEFDYEKLDPLHSLLLYLYEQLYIKEYRRYIVDGVGMCYQKIYTDEGYDTHAWKPAMSIKEFIFDTTRKGFNSKMWVNRTKKGNLIAAVNDLTDSLECEFDDLVRDRHVFSFTNGIYLSKKWNEEECKWSDQWIPYKGPKSKKIGASVVSCRLFDIDFIDCEDQDWFEIIKQNCPNFVHVMSYQQWPDEAQRWMCILIGRMLYDIKELGEDWQVIPYLLGNAGTGKSTILDNIIAKLYEVSDVGILSNNIEKKFGLSALVDKKIFIGPEIKGNLALEQAEFQSMITGEFVQVNTKFKQAKSQRFKAPGMLAGNELPNYTDNAGSMTRRVVVFPFNYKVRKGEGDTRLGEKIQKELAYIVQACNRGYLWALDEYGKKGIWDILPEFFKETKQKMAEDSNPLINFLETDHVILGPINTVYCPESIFVTAFTDHCREHHLGIPKWCNSTYNGPFSDYNIEIHKNMKRRYPNRPDGETIGGCFILGVDIKPSQKKQNSDLDDD